MADDLTPQRVESVVRALRAAASSKRPDWTRLVYLAERIDGGGLGMVTRLEADGSGDTLWLFRHPDASMIADACLAWADDLAKAGEPVWRSVAFGTVRETGDFKVKVVYDDDPEAADWHAEPANAKELNERMLATLAADGR